MPCGLDELRKLTRAKFWSGIQGASHRIHLGLAAKFPGKFKITQAKEDTITGKKGDL